MDLRQLRYFVAIVNAGTLSRAAKSLYITQPTLSLTLQKLEAEFKTSLLHSTDTGYELTATGRVLYEGARDILTSVDQLERRVHLDASHERETLRVGITVLFGLRMLPIFTEFINAHSDTVSLELVQDGSRSLQSSLAEGSIDLALVSFPKYESSLSIEPLAVAHNYDVCAVMPADHPLATSATVELADLATSRFSSFSRHFVLGEELPRLAVAAGFYPDVLFVNDDWELLLGSVQALRTVCLMPLGFKELSTHTDLAWVPLTGKANNYPIGIASRRGHSPTDAMSSLISLLRERTAQPQVH